MAKDPAFLFYSSDFITGVSDLTFEERGQYITLLCLQHQKGRLPRKSIGIAVPNATADVLAKFKIDENGLYYNERLEIEANKRKEHSEKQKQRALDGWEKRKGNNKATDITTVNATALPLENENENIIDNSKIIKVEILNSKKWIEEICMKKAITLEKCKSYLTKFLDDAELKGELNDLSDSKRHFINWLNIELKKDIPDKEAEKRKKAPDLDWFRSTEDIV